MLLGLKNTENLDAAMARSAKDPAPMGQELWAADERVTNDARHFWGSQEETRQEGSPGRRMKLQTLQLRLFTGHGTHWAVTESARVKCNCLPWLQKLRRCNKAETDRSFK
jgi:hypothetical protein